MRMMSNLTDFAWILLNQQLELGEQGVDDIFLNILMLKDLL